MSAKRQRAHSSCDERALAGASAETESYLTHLPEAQIALTDCILISKESVDLACHCLLLSNASPVLAGISDTKKDNGKHRVPLPDIDAETLRLFLQWLYRRTLPEDSADLEELLDLAAMLDVRGMLLPF